jgi:hypothetical protein
MTGEPEHHGLARHGTHPGGLTLCH